MSLIKLKIIIADGDKSAGEQLQSVLLEDHHTVVLTNNKDDLLAVCKEERPQLIILDLETFSSEMHDIIHAVKETNEIHDEPIIAIITDKCSYDYATYFGAGVDAYLVKPYDKTLARAKIHMIQEIISLRKVVRREQSMLANTQQDLLHEHEIAENIYDTITKHSCLGIPEIKLHLSSMTLFTGDLFLAAKRPSGDLNIFLGDFTGKGLAAAIGSLPTSEIFYSMTEKGFSILHILIEMNNRLTRILPSGIYCAAAFIEIDTHEHLIKVWNGGVPSACLYSPEGEIKHRFKSTHLPLAGVQNEEINQQIQVQPITISDRILLYSNRVLELTTAEGATVRESAVEKIIADSDSHHHEKVIKGLRDLTVDDNTLDSITVSEITIVHPEKSISNDDAIHDSGSSMRMEDWRFNFEARAHTMKYCEPLPLILRLLMECPELRYHHGVLFTILSELYSNALEHGILKLSSSMKENIDGFAKYYEERNKRLQALESAYVRFDFEHQLTDDGGKLIIQVEDSGDGFDYKTVQQKDIKRKGFSGRGMILLAATCESLEYQGKGNCVKVVYAWKNH